MRRGYPASRAGCDWMGRVSESQYTDLNRPPLRAVPLTRALVRPDGLWREIGIVAETGSTMADLVEAARAGAAEGTVLVAEAQTAGRGRLGRSWVAPPRAGLTFSVVLRPEVPAARRVWLPLLAGVAVATAVRKISQVRLAEPVEARLKWPNDIVAGERERKLAGILAEGVAGTTAIVLGIGLNVTTTPAELPRVTGATGATSLVLERADCTDRDPLLRAILRTLEARYLEWTAAGGDPEGSGLRRAYTELCTTLGRQVRVELPGGETLTGQAREVDSEGRLVVEDPAGDRRAVSAGEVVHVRPRPA